VTQPWQSAEARLTQLLADQAVFGLSHQEQPELMDLLRMLPEYDRDCMERTAAMVLLAMGPAEYEPLPAALHAKLRADATRRVSRRRPQRDDKPGTVC
jgi:hypothetical protein